MKRLEAGDEFLLDGIKFVVIFPPGETMNRFVRGTEIPPERYLCSRKDYCGWILTPQKANSFHLNACGSYWYVRQEQIDQAFRRGEVWKKNCKYGVE